MRDGRRAKRTALLGILISAGLILITGNLVWFTVRLDTQSLDVVGQAAAPALSGLALASLALAGALSLAPLGLRIVLGALQVALSGLVLVSTAPSLQDPVGRVVPRVTETTGIAGDDAVRSLVTGIDAAPWPLVVTGAAIVGVLSGLWILVTATRWPTPGRRYATSESVPAGSAGTTTEESPAGGQDGARSSEDEWDALSRGEDPT